MRNLCENADVSVGYGEAQTPNEALTARRLWTVLVYLFFYILKIPAILPNPDIHTWADISDTTVS